MRVPYTKATLDNGLDVIVHVDRGCPIVAVNVWYHVGSKNERPGLTGFAHLFEHLMFEGSQHHDRGYFEPLQQAGGALNGSTNTDRTNYWEVVPTNALELALWMESDRMAYLLPALTEEKFQNQRDVVLNERRQNYENRPYGLASVALMGALYAPDHPYHWVTIGAPEDLRAASLADVRAFFETHYHPGNASLTLAGDVEVDQAVDLARRYFEEIPSAAPSPPGSPPALQPRTEDLRLVMEDRVELPRLYLAWRTPPLFAPGDAELDLTAEILAGNKASRLYRTLVHDRQIAADVSAAQGSRELSSTFTIVATAAPGRTLAELDEAITAELDRLCTDGPEPRDLERSLAQVEADFVYRLQTVGGFGGKSDQLNAYNVFVGDPGYFEQDLSRFRRASIHAVRRVAAGELAKRVRVALSVVPYGRSALALGGSTMADAR